MNGRHNNDRGFSMIELMIVIVIVGIMTSLAAPQFGKTYQRMKLKGAARDLSSDFRMARSQAISGKDQVGLYFDQATRTVTIFKDIINPTAFEMESGDSVLAVDTLPAEFVYMATDCDNNVIAFKPNGAAAYSGGGNIYTIAVSDDAVCVTTGNVLASTGRMTNNIYIY